MSLALPLDLSGDHRLVDQDPAVGEGGPLPWCAAGEDDGSSRRRQTHTGGGHVGVDVLHGVVDRHHRRHLAAG